MRRNMVPTGMPPSQLKEADILPTPCQTAGAAAPWSFHDVVTANTAAGGTLVDVGCGNGKALAGLTGHFDCVIAIDPNKTILAAARETFRRKGIRNVKVCTGRWQTLPVRDASVDVVTSMFSGVHAAEAHRVLKPGGLLVVECVGPPETVETADAADRDPQSGTMEFAATLYAALRRYFADVSIRHALWPTQTRPLELTGDAFVAWDAPDATLGAPTPAQVQAVPRMRFIAVCRNPS